MTTKLGSSLPHDLFTRLSEDPDKNSKHVVIFSTLDQAGFPHHGMLSHYQLVAKDREKILMMIYSDSGSAKNIRRNHVVTLLFVDEEMSYYVKTNAREREQKIGEAENQSIFELTVKVVLEDKSPTAKISSGITFSGLDPGISAEQRYKIFKELKELAQN
jgi:Pyridoxamine 5'-phosphate oxidase